MSKFITISCLRQQTGELANRDDTGSAKALLYGGVTRTRISSQAQKRRLRTSTSPQFALEYDAVPDGIRSKYLFQNIAQQVTVLGVPEADAIAAASWLKSQIMKTKDVATSDGEKAP
jgi:CRISPR system Cascade subunit CasC